MKAQQAAADTAKPRILWRDDYKARKYAAMKQAFDRMMRDNTTRLWLYIIPATADQWGEFLICSDMESPDPTIAELATAEAIPCHMELWQLCLWLDRFANRLPMIAGNAS